MFNARELRIETLLRDLLPRSGIVWGWVFAIFLSALVGRPLQRYGEGVIGASGIEFAIWGLFGVAGGVLLCRTSMRDGVRVAAVLGVTVFFATTIPITVERLHLFKYGALAWFIALEGATSRVMSFSRAVLMAIGVSCVDELFQSYIPDRVGDLRDIGFGAIGAVLGWVAFSLSGGPRWGIGTKGCWKGF